MALAGNSTALGNLQPRMKMGASLLLQAIAAMGGSARITSTKRSKAQQTKLYNDYRTGKSKYPAAPPGQSKHELGLAVDLVVSPASLQVPLGQWWQSVGGTWGGAYQDPIHFEL
jgi:LAS superfamily LD-carboxypeptidase LdcB